MHVQNNEQKEEIRKNHWVTGLWITKYGTQTYMYPLPYDRGVTVQHEIIL